MVALYGYVYIYTIFLFATSFKYIFEIYISVYIHMQFLFTFARIHIWDTNLLTEFTEWMKYYFHTINQHFSPHSAGKMI